MQLAVQLQDIKLPKGTLTHVINVWECVSSLEHKKTHTPNKCVHICTYLLKAHSNCHFRSCSYSLTCIKTKVTDRHFRAETDKRLDLL